MTLIFFRKNISAIYFFLLFPSTVLFAQQDRPNIIWITCEDISPFIGAYGDREMKTPNIDQLAKEGVRYTKVFHSGWCLRSKPVKFHYGDVSHFDRNYAYAHHWGSKYQPVPSY